MRAVNLMPGDQRSASASSPSASSAAVYFLLAGLSGLVVIVALWTTAGKQVTDRQATLARVNVEADAAEKRADAAAPYEAFAKLASDRVATITSLSTTRFDFAGGLREISRVLPADVWLTTLNGTSGAVEATPTPTSSAAPAPRFELEGCTRSQAAVARLMARLRAVNSVRNVQLSQSVKPDQDAPEGCPANAPTDPAFKIEISFKVPGAAKEEVDATGQITAPAAPATPAAPTGTPAGAAGGEEPAAKPADPAAAPDSSTPKAG